MPNTNTKTEEVNLLLRLKNGDSLAFGQIYDCYKDRLGDSLLRLLKSEVLAEEILQDLFMKVWEQRASIDHTRAFKAYLYRIAENMVYDLFRRAAKEKEILQQITAANTELYTHVEEELLKKENVAFLEKLLDQLPSQRKKVFMTCKLEGKSYKEAAEEFGISTTTVNDHVQKAMRYLKANVNQLSALQMLFLLTGLLSEK